MKTIVEGPGRIAKIVGTQKVKDTRYRMMRYVFDVEADEGLLLHNVITGRLVRLEAEEKTGIAGIRTACESDETADAGGDMAYASELDELIAGYYLVPVDFDEAKYVEQLRNVMRMTDHNKTITAYTILPTTYCNARCYYCYEANIKHVHMSEETANDVVEFINKHHGDQKVKLSWFGGEPTLGAARISQICRRLAENGIDYDSSMISNGYLFDEKMVKEAVELWKLRQIQITLDGTEEVYNRTKAYPGIQDSAYRRVMSNIRLLLDAGIGVSVRTNLSYANADDLEKLFDVLKEQFSEYEKFHLYSHTLFDGEGFEPVQYKGKEEELLIDKQTMFDKKIGEWNKGKRTKQGLPSVRYRYCMADNSASIIINPDGTMAKCEHYQEDTCGNIKEGIISAEQIRYWREYQNLECTDCRLYPHCLALAHCGNSQRCTESEKRLKLLDFSENATKMYLDKKDGLSII